MLRSWLFAVSLVVCLMAGQPASSQPIDSPSEYLMASTAIGPVEVEVEAPAGTGSTDESRHLGPPRSRRSNEGAFQEKNSLLDRLAIPRGSVPATCAAVAFVAGLFLLATWGLKKGMPRSLQMLPADAACVLGRMPLVGRQFAHLIKVGDKLVLVAITPTGVDTLTEVTDPDQVARLLGLCQQSSPNSSPQSFEQIMRQLGMESGRPGSTSGDLSGSLSSGGRRHA